MFGHSIARILTRKNQSRFSKPTEDEPTPVVSTPTESRDESRKWHTREEGAALQLDKKPSQSFERPQERSQGDQVTPRRSEPPHSRFSHTASERAVTPVQASLSPMESRDSLREAGGLALVSGPLPYHGDPVSLERMSSERRSTEHVNDSSRGRSPPRRDIPIDLPETSTRSRDAIADGRRSSHSSSVRIRRPTTGSAEVASVPVRDAYDRGDERDYSFDRSERTVGSYDRPQQIRTNSLLERLNMSNNAGKEIAAVPPPSLRERVELPAIRSAMDQEMNVDNVQPRDGNRRGFGRGRGRGGRPRRARGGRGNYAGDS